MTEAQLAEQLLALRCRGGVPKDGPSVEAICSWVKAAAQGAAIGGESETILHGRGWVAGTTTLEYALAACEEDRSLQPIPMPDANLVVQMNYRRRRLSVEHLAATPGAILQVVVQFPARPIVHGRLRDALHAALGRSEPRERIAALLGVVQLTSDVPIQLSIIDAARREVRRLDRDQIEQWLPAIAQAEYRVLCQSGQWTRYGLLTETQRQGGVAFFAAESWLRAVGTEGQGTVLRISCRLVKAEHTWNLEAMQDSLNEIREVDPYSEVCWRDWLGQPLPTALQAHRDDFLRRLDCWD